MANIKDWFIQIRANLKGWKSDMKEVKTEAKSAAQQVDDEFKRRQIRFNTKLAQMDLNQLKSTYRSLTKQFDAQQKLNVDSRKLDELKSKMDSTKDAMKKFDDTVKSSSSSGGGLGSLTSIIGKLGIAFGATEAIRGFANFLNSSIAAARESAEAEAKLTTALTTTNRIREISVDKIKKMASSLQELTGIDDDTAIKDVYSTLVGFKNINTNDLEKLGNLVADISVGMGQDLKTSADSLGKALESPAEGSRMLRSMNIMLSESQKDLIKKFTESGDVVKAGGVIIDAISAKYTGQAKAAADAAGGTKQFAASWGDFKELIGGALIPFSNSLTKIASDLLKVTTNALDANSALNAFDEGTENVKNLETNIIPLVDRIEQLKSKSNLTKEEQTELHTAIQKVGDVLPKTVSKWDEYGKAVDINIGYARDFITVQKELLKTLHADAIDEQESRWKKAMEQRAEYINKLKNGGTYVSSGFGSQSSYQLIPFTDDQIKDLNAKIGSYTTIMDDANDKIKRLSGDFSDSASNINNTNINPNVIGSGLSDEDLEKKKDTTKAYYDSVKFADDNYYNYRKSLIDDDVKIYQAALGKNFNEKVYRNNQEKILDEDKKNWEKEHEKDGSEEKLNIIKDFYDKVKYQSDGYIDYANSQIDDQAKKYKDAGVSDVDVEKFKAEEKKKILNAFYEWQAKNDPNFKKNFVGPKVPDGKDKEDSFAYYKDYAKNGNPLTDDNLKLNVIKTNMSTAGSFVDGFFEDIVVKSDWANSMFEKGIVAMANTAIREIGKIAAEWMALQALRATMTLFGIPFTGNISTVPASTPTGVEIGAISQKYNNSSTNSGANYNAVIESNNRTTNAILALNKTLIEKDMVVNIAPGMNDIDVVKQKINPAQRRVNKSRFKSR